MDRAASKWVFSSASSILCEMWKLKISKGAQACSNWDMMKWLRAKCEIRRARTVILHIAQFVECLLWVYDVIIDYNPDRERYPKLINLGRLWPAQIGPRCLKTAHRTFLRPTIRKRNLTDDGIEEIVVATTHKCTKCAQWHFEERHGKASKFSTKKNREKNYNNIILPLQVGIKSLCSHKYLSAATNYSLDLVDKLVENALWSSLR